MYGKRGYKAIGKGQIGLLYISPWLIGFLVFQLYPFVSSFIFSFTDYSLLKTPKFVGLDNYYYMFYKDPLFWKSLLVTFIYVFFSVPAKLVFALLIALILAMKLKYINFFRTVYYIPSIMGGSVAISILWKVLFDNDGVVNRFLSFLSVGPINWLGNPDIALYTIGMLAVWQFGSSMVIFLAGLKQIPLELYEAARIDGASGIRSFFRITIPLLTPIIFFNLIMQMVNAFQEFTGALVITKGGPMNSTYLYVLKLYDEGFKFFKMGYASALSWVLFIIILLFTSLVFKSSSSWVHYEDGGKTI
jgi:oligogalacturonide transport system permease protein